MILGIGVGPSCGFTLEREKFVTRDVFSVERWNLDSWPSFRVDQERDVSADGDAKVGVIAGANRDGVNPRDIVGASRKPNAGAATGVGESTILFAPEAVAKGSEDVAVVVVFVPKDTIEDEVDSEPDAMMHVSGNMREQSFN